jgi:hypothetical protein
VPRLEVASPFLLELPAVQPPGDEVEHSGIVEPGEAHVPVIADARERAPRALELALGVARERGEFVVVVFRVDVRPLVVAARFVSEERLHVLLRQQVGRQQPRVAGAQELAQQVPTGDEASVLERRAVHRGRGEEVGGGERPKSLPDGGVRGEGQDASRAAPRERRAR